MEMCLLDTLSMVTLRVRKTKQTFFEEITSGLSETCLVYHAAISHSSSFQKAKAIFCRPWVSETPAMPSSPHLKALDLAWSWVKSRLLLGLQLCQLAKGDRILTAPSITVGAVIFSYYVRLSSASDSASIGGEGQCTGRPLPLSNVWAPLLPVLFTQTIGPQTLFLLAEILMVFYLDHVGVYVCVWRWRWGWELG